MKSQKYVDFTLVRVEYCVNGFIKKMTTEMLLIFVCTGFL